MVGASNKFAHAAIVKPGVQGGGGHLRPHQGLDLFPYFSSWIHETPPHTIHANHPEYKIIYVKGDSFTNELISAIREGRNQEFRDKYRGADVFLMDDVQFIAGRDSTQEEMFHTFNTLYELKKQIVFMTVFLSTVSPFRSW